jgi:putative methyltransferase (TIGR01177 family)
VILLQVDLSHENDALASWELESSVSALGGRSLGGAESETVHRVELPDRPAALALAARLALARRVVELWGESDAGSIAQRLRATCRAGESVSFRPSGAARRPPSAARIQPWVDAVRDAGARVDLETPNRRFWFREGSDSRLEFGEEVAEVDRAGRDARRMPKLPFRRPVSLPPKLGRVAANLGRVRPGDRVVDPFVGSGALAMESALLGARVTGVDVDATMVRGAIANFAYLSVTPEALLVGDAGSMVPSGVFDAIVTDPPYGRASTTRGEVAHDLLGRVLARWAPAVRPGGRIVVVVPGGPDPLSPPWRRLGAVRDRVHRSLTREFRVYARTSDGEPSVGPPTTS